MHQQASSLRRALFALLICALPAQAGVTAYCPPTPNSVGPGAQLAWRGPADPAQAQLIVSGLPAGAIALYVYSPAQQQIPFGNGSLCVGPPAFNLARRAADAFGRSTLQIALEGEREDVRWLLSGLLPSANFQVLYRDAASAGAKMNSSGALAVVFE